MKKIVFLAAIPCVFLFSDLQAQSSVSTKELLPGSKVFVFALSGLTLRDKPNVKAEAIEVIPYGGLVEVLSDPAQPVAFTTGNIAGRWAKIRFGENEGFAFDGYLSRLPLNNDKQRIEEYLRTVFKVRSSVTQPPEKSIVEYEKTTYDNGVIYESRMYEGGSSNSVLFPREVVSFKELYLLAKVSFPLYFSEKRKCTIAPENIKCRYDEMSTLRIEKKGTAYLIIENVAD